MKVVRVTDQNVEAALNSLKNRKELGFDVETTSTDYSKAELAVMQVYDPAQDASYLFPFNVLDSSLSQENIKKIINEYSGWNIVGHNVAYDMSILYRQFGVLPASVVDDTYLLALMRQCDDCKLKRLAVVAEPSLATKVKDFDDVMYIPGDGRLEYSFSNIDQIKYMAYDAYLPFVVREYLYKESVEKAYRVECDLVSELVKTTVEGIQIDRDKFNEAVNRCSTIRDNLQDKVNALVGYPIKVNSTAQLSRALFEERGLPTPPIKTKTGAVSVSEEALKYLVGDELVDTVLELKGAISMCSTASKIPQFFDEENKVHPQFKQIGEDGTARIYTTKPSINQWNWELRSAIVPRPGYKFVHADWKSAELYIAAYLARQYDVLEHYNNGEDIHTYLSGMLLGIANPTKDQREISKTCTFAVMYGSEGGAVERKLHCSESEAKDLVSRYLSMLSDIKRYRDKVQEEAVRTHYTYTILGRPRLLSNTFSQETLEKGKRQSFNTKVQGSCADLQKMAIIKLGEISKTKDIRFKFTVFDSFLIEVPEDYSNNQIENILDQISDFSDKFPGFKLRYDYGVGYNWDEAHR